MRLENIPIDKILLPPFLHRVSINPDGLRELANSIADIGLINPITVEKINDHYVLRAGHRRLEAHKLLGRTTIDCSIRAPDEMGNGETVTWAENLDREDLSPMEEAHTLGRAHHVHGLTIDTIARRVHRSTDWVEQRLALLALPDNLCELVHTHAIPMTHALLLATITDEAHRDYLLRYTINAGASAATLREWVRSWEMNATTDTGATAPLPEMPQPGQIYTLTMPCYLCHTVHDHTHLLIVRVCRQCATELTASNPTATRNPTARTHPDSEHTDQEESSSSRSIPRAT